MSDQFFRVAAALSRYIDLPTNQRSDAALRALAGDDVTYREARARLDARGGESASSSDVPGGPAERFELLGLLGIGVSGQVFRAFDSKLKREVALKVYHLTGSARVHPAARLKHPNIVAIHEATEFRGSLCVAMELVEGKTLAGLVDGKPLEPREAARIIRAVAEAMQCAHGEGVIHRDLKPANILLTSDDPPVPKVGDFDLAGLIGAEAVRQSRQGVVGTASYMAPEQARGRGPVGPAADIHAMGAILYECLTGGPPFRGASFNEIIAQVLHVDPVEPSKLRPGVSKDLEAVTLKCLAKSPAHRFHTAKELADELQRFLNYEPLLTRPIGPWTRAWRWSQRNPRLAAMTAVLLSLFLILAGGGTWAAAHYFALSNRLSQAVTEKDRTAAEKDLVAYANNLGRAEADILDNRDIDNAERLLRECPTDLRGWEYYHLLSRVGVQPKVFDLNGTDAPRIAGQRQGVPDGRNGIWQATLSPDGRRLALATIREGAIVYDVETRECLHQVVYKNPLTGENLPAFGVAFSPSGDLLAVATINLGSNGVAIYDLDRKQVKRFLSGHRNIVRGLAFSPDGRQLASCGYETDIRLWDVSLSGFGNSLGTLVGHQGWVNSVAFQPDGGRLASACADGEVWIWDVDLRKAVHKFRAHRSPAQWVAFSAGGTMLASVGMDGLLRLWDTKSGESRLTIAAHLGPAMGVSFTPGGSRVVTCGFDRLVKVWDAEDGRLLLALRGHDDMVWTVEFSRADRRTLVSAGFDGTARLWSATETGEDPPPRRAPRTDVNASPQLDPLYNRVTFSPDGSVGAVSGWEGQLRIFSRPGLSERTLLAPDAVAAHTGPTWNIVFDQTGGLLASASWDGTTRIWAVADGRLLHTLRLKVDADEAIPREQNGVGVGAHAVAFSPDGSDLLVGTIDGRVSIWNTRSGELKGFLKRTVPSLLAYALAWDADGRWIAASGYLPTVNVWDTRNLQAKPVALPGVPKGSVFQLLFCRERDDAASNRQRLVAASWDGNIYVWEVPRQGESWKAPLIIKGSLPGTTPGGPSNRSASAGHLDYVTSVAVSPDGRTLASGSLDKTVRFWNLSDGRPLGSRPMRGMVWGLAWHPTQRTVQVVVWYRSQPLESIEAPR